MSAQIIKASEVRAGDTLRVTFDFTVTPGLSLTDARGKTWFSKALEAAHTIERLAAPLKVGDRVKHVCGIERPIVTIEAIIDDEAVVRGEVGLRLVDLDGLRLADRVLVDGVFEVGDRVNLRSSPISHWPGVVTRITPGRPSPVAVMWDSFGLGDHHPNWLRHVPEPAQ